MSKLNQKGLGQFLYILQIKQESIDNFEKKLKNVNKQFAQLKALIKEEDFESSDNNQSPVTLPIHQHS